jgi:hypothetical protein
VLCLGEGTFLDFGACPWVDPQMQGWPRASPAVLSMQPCKNIFHIQVKLFIALFSNPTHKTETGTGNMLGTSNSKPPGPILMIGQSETLSSSQIVFITLFCAGTQHCVLPATAKYTIMLSQNHFHKPNWHILSFLHRNLMCRITY